LTFQLCQFFVRANKYNKRRFHDDPFINDIYMWGGGGETKRELKAFTFCLRAARPITGWRTHLPCHDRS